MNRFACRNQTDGLRAAGSRAPLGAVLSLLLLSTVGAPSVALGQDMALTHATVHVGDGEIIEDATVVVRAGRIASVQKGGAVPAGMQSQDLDGAVVTPGLIAAESALGLMEIEAESSSRDDAMAVDDPIRADYRAAEGFNPRSSLIPVARRWGILNAVATPAGGLISGVSAWVDLGGDDARANLGGVVQNITALHIDLSRWGQSSAGGTIPAALMRLREVFDDARLYGRSRAAYDRRAMRASRVSRLDLERLQDVLAGRVPVVVGVSRASDILEVLSLAASYGLRLVLSGAEEAHLVRADLAQARVPVIVQPLANLPSSFSALATRYDNAALLEAAGVKVLLSAGSAHDIRNLRQQAANAVAFGLPREKALSTMTSRVAEVFGMDRDYGSVARGKVANLVVWQGDPLSLSAWPTAAFVRGRAVTLSSRQTELFHRYRDLQKVRNGLPGAPPVREVAPPAIHRIGGPKDEVDAAAQEPK